MEEEKASPVKMIHHRSVWMVQIFKQDMTVTSGSQLVRRAQLLPSSPLSRLYTGCCNTPVGLVPKLSSYPFIICHMELFGEEGAALLGPHSWALFTSRQYGTDEALPEALTNNGQAVSSRGLGHSFLFRVIFRVLYGLFRGKGKPDPTLDFPAHPVEYLKTADRKKGD